MNVVAAYIDEVSMIASDQFLQCYVRSRQANMNSDARFGNLAVNICGDFLQLPPVDKQKGSRRSLAMPLDHHGRCDAEEATPDNALHHDRSVASRLAEARQDSNCGAPLPALCVWQSMSVHLGYLVVCKQR